MNEHDPFCGLAPSRVPSELRGQVLRAARNALAQGAAQHNVWRALWESRALRVGWSTVCAVLLSGHLVLTLWPRRSPSAAERLVVTPVRELSPELRDVLYLPPTERLELVINYGPHATDGAAKNPPLLGGARKG
jgi:hypothetical protein